MVKIIVPPTIYIHSNACITVIADTHIMEDTLMGGTHMEAILMEVTHIVDTLPL